MRRCAGLDVLHGVGAEACLGGRVDVLHPDARVLRDGLREPVGAPADFDEVLQVVEGDFAEAVEALLPVVHEEHGEQHDVAEQEGEFGQSADAVLHPGEHRDGRDARDAEDDPDLVVQVLLDGPVGDDAQACVQLHDPEPEGGADAEHGRDDGERVDELAQPAVDLLAEDGLEARAFVHGQVEPERDQAEQQAVDGLDAEGVQAPVEHGHVQRVDGPLVVVRVLVAVRAHVVPHRFSHALEGQPNCHAG